MNIEFDDKMKTKPVSF